MQPYETTCKQLVFASSLCRAAQTVETNHDTEIKEHVFSFLFDMNYDICLQRRSKLLQPGSRFVVMYLYISNKLPFRGL